MKKFVSILVLLVVLGANSVNAASNATARINGITDFLIERANQTFFHIFENKLKENKDFHCYFPETYSYVADGDLKALIKSQEVWQDAMDKDFETLFIRTIAAGINKSVNLNKLALDVTSEYAELVQFLKIKIDDKSYDLNLIVPGTPTDHIDIINVFYNDFVDAIEILRNTNKKLSKYADVCSTVMPTKQAMQNNLDKLEVASKKLKDWMNGIQQHKGKLTVDKVKLKEECARNPKLSVCRAQAHIVDNLIPKIKESLENPILGAVAYSAYLKVHIDKIKKRKTYTSKVVEAFKKIKEEDLDRSEKLKKLKTYLLFVAQLADSDDSGDVKDLLQEYTLPAASFLTKRETDVSHLFISAYLAYGIGTIVNDNDVDSDNTHGFYVPLGLEYTHGTKSENSLSFMFSPFDFGYPVSLKMNGEEEDVELDEIIAPSISVSYGIRDYPLSVGLAYQVGRKDIVTGNEEERVLLFVGFDMPLFPLY